MRESEPSSAICDALRVSAATLRDASVPFMLAGSMAIWARGGSATRNDLDLVVRECDARTAADALVRAGLREQRVPEEWLRKLWHGEVAVDLIFRLARQSVTDEALARAEHLSVLALEMPVMALEDVLAAQLNALGPHSLDFSATLAAARAVREQIDWTGLRALTAASPFAGAFFTLTERLGVSPPRESADGPSPRAPRRLQIERI